MKRWLIIGTLLISLLAQASVDLYPFETAPARQRFIHLLSQYRCLVCQNQTLADSDALLAKDLRREIYTRVKQGDSDQQIQQYLVSRYSDYVRFKPPLNRQTWLLWFGPLGLLLLGIAVIRVIVRRR